MELTQEYFDKGLSNMMNQISEEFSSIRNEMATKTDLANLSEELKHYTGEAFEMQQIWMEERFGELITLYDVRDRVDKLEKDFLQFKHKANKIL